MARTIEFSRDDVLQNATELFWQKGYCMTSIPNLVEATKLNPGSIYAAFKSKEGLFIAALEHYGQCGVMQLQETLANADTPLKGVRTFMQNIAATVTDKNQRGCFLINTVLEMSSQYPKVQKEVEKQLNGIEVELQKALKSAHESGELSDNQIPEVLAKYLMVNIWGLRVLAKTNSDKSNVAPILDQVLASLQS